MKNLLVINSFFLFTQYLFAVQECRLESYLVSKKSIFTECEKGHPYKGQDFFGMYVEVENNLYSIIGWKPMSSELCRLMKERVDKIISKSDKIRVEATGVRKKAEPSKYVNDKVPLLKQHNWMITNTFMYSQISNGKDCACWLEPCKCLSLDAVNYGKDNCYDN